MKGGSTVNPDRALDYIMRMRPLLKKEALFSDETEMFRKPMEADPGQMMTIRFRTASNNADDVWLIHGNERLPMEFESCDGAFDYYAISVCVHEEDFEYIFEIRLGRTDCFYDRMGVTRNPDPRYRFRILTGFHTPDWAKGAVMYQIFVDRFCNGDTSNDVLSDEYSYIGHHVKRIMNWYEAPEAMDVRNFHGGDLAGVIRKLDYLQNLGVQVIYLNPVFVSASNHKYDIQDYDHVDPHFGKIINDSGELLKDNDQDNTHATRYISRVTDQRNLEAGNELLAELVQKAHDRGIRVILDGVFNHCGSFNRWMDREHIYENRPGFETGAYISEDSPYHSYFRFAGGSRWPDNGQYEQWWGNETLPKLNYEDSEALQNDILRIAAKWVSPPYNCDGWRLDVAADLGHSLRFNHLFWKKFRRTVKEANPEAIILAEHYGDAWDWLRGDEWDTVMNYDAFMEPVTWFITGMEKHSDEFQEGLLSNADNFINAMRYHMASFPEPSLLTSMNELDNHDHSRFLTRTNHVVGRVQNLGTLVADNNVDKAALREAVVIQMTWPGAPTIYYGDEAGMCGFTDPDSRRAYPWGMEDRNILEFYREIIRIHERYRALQTGSVKVLFKDYGELVYARFNEEQIFYVLINNRTEKYHLETSIWQAGMNRLVETELSCIMSTDREGFAAGGSPVRVVYGCISVDLAPESALLLMAETDRS